MTKSDHKRKARPIATAVVTCTADSITVVIPDVLGKNESHVAGQDGARHTSTMTKRIRESVRKGINDWRGAETTMAIVDGRMSTVCDSQAHDGAWRVEILACWDRERHTIDGRPVGFTCPMGDVDAPIAQVFDALQHAGILDDDARVVEVRAWNMYRKDVRATIVRLVRVPYLSDRDKDIYHLAKHVPPSPEQPAKPRTKAARRRAKENAT